MALSSQGVDLNSQLQSLAQALTAGVDVSSLTASLLGQAGAPSFEGAGAGLHQLALEASATSPQAMVNAQRTGVVQTEKGSFGFIKQDSGEPDLFFLPPIPPVGTRVMYDVSVDPVTKRPRAENVQQLDSASSLGAFAGLDVSAAGLGALGMGSLNLCAAGAGQAPGGLDFNGLDPTLLSTLASALAATGVGADACWQQDANAPPSFMPQANQLSGTVVSISNNGNFGFIKQDSGGSDMFALPPLPPPGTRVVYDVVMDPKKGRPRAENVQAADGIAAFGPAAFGPAATGFRSNVRSEPYGRAAGWQPTTTRPTDNLLIGTVKMVNEKFGFIQQDSGEADMFVIPPACEAFGRTLPPIGTRVSYRVVIDGKTGRPRADGVAPADTGAYAG